MSAPLRPLPLPLPRSSSTSSPSPLTLSAAEGSSASSSVTASAGKPSRADQVVYRFYVKTVAVLVQGRLTHYGYGVGKGGDKKKDKWFNLVLPEVDLHKNDLQIYRTMSSYAGSRPNTDDYGIPPLLVAFILDTSDLLNGQALVWNREDGKFTLDSGLLSSGGKGKGKDADQRTGIVLERWTLRAGPCTTSPSASQMAPHTAYRLGIIHFRALFALVRLLPAYRVFRRLRRAKNGLRLGIKLWAPEGYPDTSEGLAAAWEVMERGLVSLDVGLDELVSGQDVPSENVERFDLPPADLFGSAYSIGVDYRPDVDLQVEDLESVLSEKFVDMDEDWFTPTVARHRLDDNATRSAISDLKVTRKVSNPTAIPATSPIPPRQQAATPGSFGSVGLGTSKSNASRIASAAGTQGRSNTGSGGSGRWGLLAEGLPFAAPAGSTSIEGARPPSPGVPSGASVAARRLSGHSIQPFNMSSSPSTSLLRSTPPNQQALHPHTNRPGSSVGRTSSFLSQSGRSFTHAQLANMSPPVGSSPPVHSPNSPSSLSFTKQPIPRSLSGRPAYTTPSNSSPFIPGSLERDTQTPGTAGQSQVAKRYSLSLSQRPVRLGGSHSSGEGTSLPENPGSVGPTLLRRSSTRTSQESGLRYSTPAPGPDDEDIQAFLKTLDALPQPPSLAAQAIHASRSHLPSTSSSLSNPSVPPSPSPLHGSIGSPGQGTGAAAVPTGRAPMTRTQVDDALRRMAGSFNLNTSKLVESTVAADVGSSRQPSPSSASGSGSHVPSVGLLTASRPESAPRKVPPLDPETPRPGLRQQSSIKTGSPLASSPAQLPLPESPTPESKTKSPALGHPTARSLPGTGGGSLLEDVASPLPFAMPIGTAHLSPQTTGTSTATNESRASASRRGPVLLRGGFEGRATKASTSSSPSHSPIRDFARLGLNAGNRLGGATSARSDSTNLGYGFVRKSAAQHTAPSSFGGRVDGADDEEEERGRRNARRSEDDIGSKLDDEVPPRRKAGGALSGDW